MVSSFYTPEAEYRVTSCVARSSSYAKVSFEDSACQREMKTKTKTNMSGLWPWVQASCIERFISSPELSIGEWMWLLNPHVNHECKAVCPCPNTTMESGTRIIGFLSAIELNDTGQSFLFVRTEARRSWMTLTREGGAGESRQSCRTGQKPEN